MSKYRLKDQELQRHLDAISDGAFTANLTAGDFEFDEDDMAVVTFGSSMHDTKIIASKFSVILHKNETYVLAEYNPNDWNAYPDVTPPEGVWMRAEVQYKNENRIYRCAAIFKDGKWCGCTGSPFSPSNRIKRYRPWE